MPFFIVRDDITKMHVDAIVNAANNSLMGGGGVDGAIHEAAGPGLDSECEKLHGCETGQAKMTGAYDLPCRYIIHTVGPVWYGGRHNEEKLLKSCYEKSLDLAKANGVTSIAFPLISSGAYGYPKNAALNVAIRAIKKFLTENDMTVYLVIFCGQTLDLPTTQSNRIKRYIQLCSLDKQLRRNIEEDEIAKCEMPSCYEFDNACALIDLDTELAQLDESFQEMLFRLIDEKKMTDVECYKKANVDRKVFSKIRSSRDYRPSKTTAVAFAIALKLPLYEAKRLIELAGYSLTHSNKFDIIIEYCIVNKEYDIYKINEWLFAYDQKLLGC